METYFFIGLILTDARSYLQNHRLMLLIEDLHHLSWSFVVFLKDSDKTWLDVAVFQSNSLTFCFGITF